MREDNRMKTTFISILLCIVIGSIGCAAQTALRSAEPSTIVIYNSTNVNFKYVTLKGPKNRSDFARTGTISPLPAGASQVIGRPDDPPPLPQRIVICWGRVRNSEHCREIDLRQILKQSSGSDQALVFEVRSPTEIIAFVRMFRQGSGRP